MQTETEVVALRSNKAKPGRDSTGMVLLEITAANQRGETVMHFWRCPMIACRNPIPPPEHQDDFDQLTTSLSFDQVLKACPADWNLNEFRHQHMIRLFTDLRIGQEFEVESRDTITSAPELVRATLNMAMTHTDAGASYLSERLVYGGHVISMAFAQATRALPSLVTILGWFQCNHLAPVTEGDCIQTRVVIEHLKPLAVGGIATIKIESTADSTRGLVPVLSWQVAVLVR